MARIVRPPSVKLTRPPLREPTLHRLRLYNNLDDALRHGVTLITGDAGFGKSTLVAGYLAQRSRPALWYRIDGTDNDPGIFAAALLEGAKPFVPPRVYRAARRSLAVVSDWAAVAPVIAGVLDVLPAELCIILDDYHVLDGVGVAAGMAQLVEDLPHRVHLAILSRVRPELPLARWRARGSLAEIDSDDLRFTTPEMKMLLVDLHGLPFSDASLRLLAAKTEGWAAGIVLALHAAMAQGPAAATQTIAAVSGSSRAIYEYLAQEALARQPRDVRTFLLVTSVLSRFSAELADALLGRTDSQRVIDYLERSHLFIIPLDAERRWYRYHHLFQEFLQRVALGEDRDLVRAAHLRAGKLWEDREDVRTAIGHYAAAGAMTDVARLLAADGLAMIARGQFATVRHWLERTPPPAWHAYPRLFLVNAMGLTVERRDMESMQSAEEGWRRLREAGDREGEALALWHFGRGAILMAPAALSEALADILPRTGQFSAHAQARILEIAGREAMIRGRVSDGQRLYGEALRAARAGGDLYTEVDVGRYIALAWGFVGRFRDAETGLRTLVERLSGAGMTHEEAHMHTAQAMIFHLTGENEAAADHIAKAGFLEATIPCKVLRIELNWLRARVAHRRGDDEDAERLLRSVLQPDTSWARLGFVMPHLSVDLSQVVVRRDPQEARRLAEDAVRDSAGVGPYRQGEAALALGLVTGSAAECLRAAEFFAQCQAVHMRALALVQAERLGRSDLHAASVEALQGLQEDGLAFVAAAHGVNLAPYRSEPNLGPRITALLDRLRASGPAQIEIRCLGRFEVERGGVPIPQKDWPRTTARRLLQYLAVAHRPVHREQIMDALWPDAGVREAANQLRVALSALRRALEPARPPRQQSALIVTEAGTVTLARDLMQLDVDAFRQAVREAQQASHDDRRAALQRAVSLYGGDLLADSPYEEWAAGDRDRLLEDYLNVRTSLGEAEEAVGAWDRALANWQEVRARNPGAEHAYRGLMRCYLALGRTGEAASAFDACRAALEDLGVPLSEETLHLRETFTLPPSASV